MKPPVHPPTLAPMVKAHGAVLLMLAAVDEFKRTGRVPS